MGTLDYNLWYVKHLMKPNAPKQTVAMQLNNNLLSEP